jgi:mannitol/fructose-specific phosphotransferase system IIA component (Ntr-type)/Kef-type K+ transport system membrane component KefB
MRERRLHLLVAALALAAPSFVRAASAPSPADAAPRQMAALLLLLGLLTAAARLGGMLFERWRLPALPGELAAGFVFGPALLGGVPLPGFPDGLHGVAVAALAPGGPLTALLLWALTGLFFLAGLETDMRLLLRPQRPNGLWIGVGGSLGAFLLTALALQLAGPALGMPPFLAPAGFFLCAAAAFSSAGVAARVLADQRRLESPEGVGIMSAALTDNLLGMFWLSVAAGCAGAMARARPVDAGAAAALAGRILLLNAAILLPAGPVALAAGRRLGRVTGEPRHPSGVAACALAAALLAAGLFGRAGLSAPAGAYLAGLAVAGSGWRHVVQERLEFLHAALAPTAFALAAMAFAPRRLPGSAFWLFALLYVLATVGGKLLGSLLPARLAGFNARGRLRAGLGLAPRGDITLAVVLTGLVGGVLDETGVAAAGLLVCLTCLATPSLLRLAFANGAAGVPGSIPPPATRHLPFRFPSPGAARLIIDRLIDVLEEDGFHVRLLNRRAAIYQLGREETAIGLRLEGGAMIVDCAADDQPLVNSAMIEVLAGIETNLRELRRPLDAAALVRAMQNGGRPRSLPAALPLKGILSPGTLRPRLLADTKAAAITELVEMLHEEGLVRDRHGALEAVIAREEALSTGLEHGVAMPHARTDAVSRLVCAVGLKREGIDFGTPDGRPVRIIVLLLAPLSVPAPLLQAMTVFSRILDERGRSALLACDTPEDMHAVLAGAADPAAKHAPGGGGALEGLEWHAIALDLGGRTREEIIDHLLALCARSGAVADLDEARRAILARERKASTAMEHGIALPHARTEAVERMVCALGLSRAGVDFGSLDGKPSHIFVLALMPPDVTTAYTRFTAAVMRALDEEGRKALMAARGGREAMAVLMRGAKG